MHIKRVAQALKASGIKFVSASPSDWIDDDAVWVGDTTLVGVSGEEALIHVITRTDQWEDEHHGTWELVDDQIAEVVRLVRRLQLRDAVAQALATGLLTPPDCDWAKDRRRFVASPDYVPPSGPRRP